MCLPLRVLNCAQPLIARLLASVAPEVQTTSRGSAPIKLATSTRASSTAASACQPNICERDAGLPKWPDGVKNSTIRSATAGSTGVVDA